MRRRNISAVFNGRTYKLKKTDPAYKIFKWFIQPLVEFVGININEEGEGAWSLSDVVSFVFGAPQRVTKEFRVVTPIERMPGLFKVLPNKFCQSSGPRHVYRGWHVLVVYDERVKSFVDIEVFKDWDCEKSAIFRLTPRDYESIIGSLEQIKFKKNTTTRRARKKKRGRPKGRRTWRSRMRKIGGGEGE